MKIKPTGKPGRVVVEIDSEDEQLLENVGGRTKTSSAFQLKKVLVPIDFSECSKKALHYAIAFAKQFNASLTLMHVVYINYGFGEFAAIDYPLLEKQVREGTEKQLRELATEEIGESLMTDTLVYTGVASREIVEAARSLECDLIIMSTHGHTGLKHVMLGSTTENVVRHAPCPVLVVRENEHEFINSHN